MGARDQLSPDVTKQKFGADGPRPKLIRQWMAGSWLEHGIGHIAPMHTQRRLANEQLNSNVSPDCGTHRGIRLQGKGIEVYSRE